MSITGWLRRRRRFVAAALLTWALGLAAPFGWWFVVRPFTAPIGHDQAVVLARDYISSPATHGSGTTVSNVTVRSADLATDATGRPAWKVNVTGDVTEAANSVTYVSAMWLYVDVQTGAITVFAAG
jgi:hypothetical protein